MELKNNLRTYFIMGSNNCKGDPLDVLEAALKGGISLFQFREKGEDAEIGKEKKDLAFQMKQLCTKYNVPFIVNDDVSLALDVGADGVHVGQEDESVSTIKKYSPVDFIVGVSATNVDEAIQAEKDGADYIGIGPIYQTSTKADAKTPIGLDGISQIREYVGGIPLVAIGGIKPEHVRDIIESGADGVSFITAVSQAGSPENAVIEIKKLVDSVVY
ncbi:thiamine phosphate synthase [Aquibacillus rhizosphaerae]|uniref:Thiamine-phosphate synthase n=1 Tax=Aquibacillus rhizosphaerae TaxID=3051431 RepID=A0ABT7L5G7_9BACI|nr:thiamine phosphate synthase [Aquibacillus sp. LR5S19]MDL4841112.1 thiamine phosphate synthase [Aquibacillus sp. LR5S19]